MGLVNQRARCEVPDDWRQEIANSRRKPNHSSLQTLNSYKAKYKELQILKNVCPPTAREYFSLPPINESQEVNNSE
ncbi:hypothetical protein ANN_13974 [Periplaneta americana]|uniref:Uncharacterized protein n=1 Tax=Periplaneta americana TaxID=6978 RepID=A0ABQ8SWB3_PERAM|nr:hypothetical protein ANN_13974 [Periplaneta americana]